VTALWTWIKALFAYLAGWNAGVAAQVSADQTAQEAADARVAKAEVDSPDDRAALERRLQSGKF
jgi:hypothetical protein